jgi:hypothetical protein
MQSVDHIDSSSVVQSLLTESVAVVQKLKSKKLFTNGYVLRTLLDYAGSIDYEVMHAVHSRSVCLVVCKTWCNLILLTPFNFSNSPRTRAVKVQDT